MQTRRLRRNEALFKLAGLTLRLCRSFEDPFELPLQSETRFAYSELRLELFSQLIKRLLYGLQIKVLTLFEKKFHSRNGLDFRTCPVLSLI